MFWNYLRQIVPYLHIACRINWRVIWRVNWVTYHPHSVRELRIILSTSSIFLELYNQSDTTHTKRVVKIKSLISSQGFFSYYFGPLTTANNLAMQKVKCTRSNKSASLESTCNPWPYESLGTLSTFPSIFWNVTQKIKDTHCVLYVKI